MDIETRIDERPGRKQPFVVWAKTGAEGQGWELWHFARTYEEAKALAKGIPDELAAPHRGHV